MPKSYVNTYYDSGTKMSNGWLKSDKKVGFWQFFHKNGVLKEEGHYNNNLKTGYWISYYSNGAIKEKGNFENNKKTGYWFFYDENSKKVKEGHFDRNIPKKWWRYYKRDTFEKCIYQKDGETRYCLIYAGKKLIKGSKYISDTFIQEWTSLSSFKRDNPNFSF